MEKVFVEYAIAEQSLQLYRSFMASKRREGLDFEWYEGTDQPGLFVEVWPGLSYEQYEELKRQRIDPADPAWGQLGVWVRGGHAKVHIWHFTEL